MSCFQQITSVFIVFYKCEEQLQNLSTCFQHPVRNTTWNLTCTRQTMEISKSPEPLIFKQQSKISPSSIFIKRGRKLHRQRQCGNMIVDYQLSSLLQYLKFTKEAKGQQVTSCSLFLQLFIINVTVKPYVCVHPTREYK